MRADVRVLNRLAYVFIVSLLVILRRLYDVGDMDQAASHYACRSESNRLAGLGRCPGGGVNYVPSIAEGMGRRFAHILAVSTLYGEVFRMLAISRTGIFNRVACAVGVAA